MRRRSVLRAGIVLPFVTLGGCTGSPASSPSSPSPSPSPSASPPPNPTDEPASDGTVRTTSETPTDSPRTPTGVAGIDLREANVTGVAFSASDRTLDFDVTLHHDDDGEDGYADWWQVERLDGTRLGRRELLHAHGTREFTRSGSIEVPEGVTCVIVRGHDRTHGYGGQAALVDIDSGTVRFVRQGPDPQSFSAVDCP